MQIDGMTEGCKAGDSEIAGQPERFDGLDPMTQKKIDWARTFVRFPRELKIAATAHARKRKVSFNTMLVHALIELVKRWDADEAKGKK